MKKLILAISILAAMACADVVGYDGRNLDGRSTTIFYYEKTPIKLTDFFDGKWYACNSYTTDQYGDTVKETRYDGYERTVSYNRLLKVKTVNISQYGKHTTYEINEIEVDGRHEIRKVRIDKDGIVTWSYTTLDSNGCPLALYSTKDGRLYEEYKNDSHCRPQSRKYGKGGSLYGYDGNGRLMSHLETFSDGSTMASYFNEDGDLIKYETDTQSDTYSYIKDKVGRITAVFKRSFFNRNAPKKFAVSVQDYSMYFKYFVKGNTTYQCLTDMGGNPVDRSYGLFIRDVTWEIEDGNGKFIYTHF